ncbi:hypothetical protein TEPIDINF_001709 [Tepidibacillus infernus]|uniref:hypothetical protein n=1 Tax=Tepidibacillus infernus TaxID=1806172 RepID=UPI003B734BAB
MLSFLINNILPTGVCRFFKLREVGIYNLYDPEVILIGGGISVREDFHQNANLLGAVYGIIKIEVK